MPIKAKQINMVEKSIVATRICVSTEILFARTKGEEISNNIAPNIAKPAVMLISDFILLK